MPVVQGALILLLACMTWNGQAQEVEDKVVIIEKEAKLELPVANRNFQKIVFEPSRAKSKPQQYDFKEVDLELPKLAAKIKVPTIPPDPLSKLYGNYVKAGFGNYTTPYLEGFFNNKRSDKLNYGAHFKYLSSRNGSVKSDKVAALSGTSLMELGASVRYFEEKIIFKGGLDFSSRGYKYYGFDKSILSQPQFNESLLKDSIRQRYNTFIISAGLENRDKTDKLNYDLGFQYFNFSDRFKAKEGEFITNANLKYSLEDDKAIHVTGLLSVSNRKDSSSIGRTFFQLKPSYHFKRDGFSLRVGFNVAYTNDSLKVYNKLHFYPSVHGEYTVIEKTLTAYAGIDGEMQKNTLRTFTRDNPYLGHNIPLYNTNKAIELYVGGKGNLTDKLNYLVRLAYINYKNLYLFNNSISDTSKFSVFYAKGNSSVVNFTADISYEATDKFRVGLLANFYGYSISPDSLSAWHRPNVLTSVYATYNLYDKIFVNADFYYISGLKGRNFITGRGKDNSLPAIADLNLKIDYRVSPVFSVFLEVNNLLSNKYQLYQYYQVKGINVLAGISYSF